jgi:hypothetical protein
MSFLLSSGVCYHDPFYMNKFSFSEQRTSVVDRHRFDVSPNPDPNFHVDTDTDPDPD